MTDAQAWSGFIHVRPTSASSAALGETARGGYASVLALALDAADYRRLVEREMATLGLAVVESERIAPLSTFEVEGEIAELSQALNERYPVQYRTFDTYSQDDA